MKFDQELLDRIKNNDKTLISLHLLSNNIGEQEAKDIANALLTNKTLTDLRLGGNNIGEQ